MPRPTATENRRCCPGPRHATKGADVGSMWLMPLQFDSHAGSALAADTRLTRPMREIDPVAQALLRDHRIAALREPLAREPEVVWSAHRPHRLLGQSNRLVLQLDDEQIDASC